MGRIGRIVENRDSGYFGNSFFEQLQPLAAEVSGKECQAGDITAGTGQAFNQACLDRITTGARHHDGNGLGRLFHDLHVDRPASHHDDIYLETHQLGHDVMVPFELRTASSIFNGYVLSFYVAKRAQSQPNAIESAGISRRIGRR